MRIDLVLEIVGVIVPLLSSLASLFNGKVRAKQAQGVEVPPFMAKAGAVLNVGAMNFDKAHQLLSMVKTVTASKAASDDQKPE